MNKKLIALYIILAPILPVLSIFKFQLFSLKLSMLITLFIWGGVFVEIIIKFSLGFKIKIDKNQLILLLIAIFAIFKFIISPHDIYSVFFPVAWAILYFIGLNIDNKEDMDVFLKISGLFVIFLGIILYWLNIPLFDPEFAGSESYFSEQGKYRAMSTLVNPNAFGYFVIVFLIFNINDNKYTLKKIFLLVLCFYTILITKSRSSLIIFIYLFMKFYLEFFYYKFKNNFRDYSKYTKYCIISINVILIILIVYTGFFYISNQLIKFEDIITNIRWKKWKVALIFIFKNSKTFLIGNPFGTTFNQGSISFSDNYMLHIFLEYGVIGLILFCWFYLRNLVICIKKCFKIKVERRKRVKIKFDLIIFFLIAGLFSNIYEIIPLTFYIPLFLSLYKYDL